MKFCEVSWNTYSNWYWKFQLSSLKSKKVLFLKKYNLGLNRPWELQQMAFAVPIFSEGFARDLWISRPPHYPLGEQESSGWLYKIEWNYRENVGSWKIRKFLQKEFQPIVSYTSRKTCHEAGWDRNLHWFSTEPTFFNFFFARFATFFFAEIYFAFQKETLEVTRFT